MKEFAFIACKEAAPKLRSGSYADGMAGQGVRLPLAVVGPHVNLPSSDHSEMASDANRFPSCFLALRAKTLSEAKNELDCDHNKSMNNNCKLESLERLVKSTSSALLQNKWSICLSTGRRSLKISLESAPIHTDHNPSAKIRHISESAKYSDSFANALPLRSLSLPKRPISSLNLLKPARSLSLPKRPGPNQYRCRPGFTDRPRTAIDHEC